MAHCKNCGKQEVESVKFCTSCGSPLTAAEPEAVAATPGAAQATPAVAPPGPSPMPGEPSPAQSRSESYKEEPISTGGYFGILFLLMIPLLNLLLLILWACGGCRKTGKRNFARAALLWTVVGVVLSVLFVLVGGLLLGEQFDALKEMLTKYPGRG